MNTEEKYNLIEKYLANKLEGDELANFEKSLLEDNELKAEVELHQQLESTLKGEKVHQFRDALKKVDNDWQGVDEPQQAKVRSFNFRRLTSIAAAILLLVAAYLFLIPKKNTPQELFATHFETYPMILNQRSGTDEPANTTLLNDAIKNYEQGDFQQAIQEFQTLQLQEPNTPAYSFYEGLSQLSNQKTEDAILIFKKLLDTPDHAFVEQSRWYLGMAHLKKGNISDVKAVLELIKEREFKFKEAHQLLEEL